MTESDVLIFCLQARIKYEEDDDDDFIDDNDDSNVCLVGVPNLPPCCALAGPISWESQVPVIARFLASISGVSTTHWGSGPLLVPFG